MSELREQFDEMMLLYDNIKRRIKAELPHEYERWKAGGFLVDPDIMSMYPHLERVIDLMDDDEDFDDEEDEE